jgi:hypothetical protein
MCYHPDLVKCSTVLKVLSFLVALAICRGNWKGTNLGDVENGGGCSKEGSGNCDKLSALAYSCVGLILMLY